MFLSQLDKHNENWRFKQTEGLLLIVSGPSGVGKGTILRELIQLEPEKIVLSVSVTTRKPRVGEVDTVDYFFKSIDEFSDLIEKDQLLEYACVFDGKLYGTPREYVEEMVSQGKNVILEIDVQGALQVKKKWKNGVYVFILPPNIKELERRLRSRNTEDEEAIQNRLAMAHKEMEYLSEYDYIFVNDDLQNSIDSMKAILIAEHCKIKRKIKEVN